MEIRGGIHAMQQRKAGCATTASPDVLRLSLSLSLSLSLALSLYPSSHCTSNSYITSVANQLFTPLLPSVLLPHSYSPVARARFAELNARASGRAGQVPTKPSGRHQPNDKLVQSSSVYFEHAAIAR
jgi:hypothetical protein